jgi:hydroxymethylpyrimidine/phosphomethylpyrimidine kinase
VKVPRILIIAGSDSGGGAGIQADIKTVTMMGGHAMTAITALTAQNTLGVDAVMPVPADMVLKQIDAVVSDIGVDAVKIGMIGSPEVAEAVAERLSSLSVPIVFDPVMVASSGAALASPETITAFRKLMEVSTVVTPNAPELAALTHLPVGTLEELHQAAIGLARDLDMWVLAKGGHLAGAEVVDVLASSEGRRREFRGSRIDSRHHHGTGCTLASAVAAGLARGEDIGDAVEAGRRFVRTAMAAAPGFGQGHGPMGHWAATAGAMNLNQVTVGAADYDESVRFYRMLGLRQIVDAPPRYARFECPGGATFSIHVEDGPNTGSETVIYFETANLDDVVQQLSSNGVELRSMPQDQSWLWREARLLDPAGNRICLYWAGENRRFPPWRLAD